MADNRRGGFTQEAKLVRNLAAILDETGLTEIEVEVGETRVRVARAAATVAASPGPALPAPAPPAATAPTPAPPASAAIAEEPAASVGEVVKSPMVGTAYLQPTPGAEPFVRAGSTVSEGQTLVLIEAMKTMNPIAAPRAGTVVEILIEDGAPVEYGEPLVVIG